MINSNKSEVNVLKDEYYYFNEAKIKIKNLLETNKELKRELEKKSEIQKKIVGIAQYLLNENKNLRIANTKLDNKVTALRNEIHNIGNEVAGEELEEFDSAYQKSLDLIREIRISKPKRTTEFEFYREGSKIPRWNQNKKNELSMDQETEETDLIPKNSTDKIKKENIKKPDWNKSTKI